MKLTILAAIVPALMFAGCSEPPTAPPFPTVELPPSAGQGIDMASDSSDVLNELKDAQLEFVARYYREAGLL